MNFKYFIFYPILTAVILSLAWPANGFPFLIFFGFVPLMILEYRVKKFSFKNIFLPALLSFCLWNFCTTYWILYASFTGMIIAVILNSIFMSFVFFGYSFIRRKTSFKIGLFSFIFLWLAFEYLHYNWDLSWTWLTLGNIFSNYTFFIQWYEFTGVLGGSLWVLISNVLLFSFFISKQKKYLYSFFIVFIILVFCCFFLSKQEFNYKVVDVVVVQPNIDPYEKFQVDIIQQVDSLKNLALKELDVNVDFLVVPETFLYNAILEEQISTDYILNNYLLKSLNNFPNLNLIIGAVTAQFDSSIKNLKLGDKNNLKFFNSALFVKYDNSIKIHHKAKLVPGTEIIPLPKIFGWLSGVFEKMGGVTGNYGQGNKIPVFSYLDYSQNSEINFSVSICYESIFGEFISKGFLKGSELLFVITNDGWWRDSPGYKQHLSYSRLRAIENRKPIVRCANTGISCFIDVFGNVDSQTSWWEKDCIRKEILTNKKLTFYSKHGDYLGRIAVFLSVLIILYSFVFIRIRKNS